MRSEPITVPLQVLAVCNDQPVPWLRPASNIHQGWKTSIALKEDLGIPGDVDEYNHAAVKEAAQKAHQWLEAFRTGDLAAALNIDTGELEWISDEFHTLGFADDEPRCSEFDAVLERLYDWADCERVIIR